MLTVDPGPGFVARLREALRDAPAAARVVIQVSGHPPSVSAGIPGDAPGVVTVPVSDTVKEVVEGKVRRTVPRETVAQVIGPWIFDRDALADALTRVAGGDTDLSDMIGLCQAAHLRVRALPAR